MALFNALDNVNEDGGESKSNLYKKAIVTFGATGL